MTRACHFTVCYDSNEVAKFTSYADAITFARSQRNAEVSNKTGLIDQFVNGNRTPEFAHLDKMER